MFTRVVRLLDLLFGHDSDPYADVRAWQPPALVEPALLPAFGWDPADLPLEPFYEKKLGPWLNVELEAYNTRLSRIAQATSELASELAIAGLPRGDADWWKRHSDCAPEILRYPSGGHKRWVDLSFVDEEQLFDGVNTFLAPDHILDNVGRLEQVRGFLARLRTAARRIERTISPQAVLDRLHVSDNRAQVIFDGKCYSDLSDGAGTYLWYLRRGAGEWVSSTEIEEKENIADFKPKRAVTWLERKNPALQKTIVVKKGGGSRIVLPLPPG
jgi:hypothetical protein